MGAGLTPGAGGGRAVGKVEAGLLPRTRRPALGHLTEHSTSSGAAAPARHQASGTHGRGGQGPAGLPCAGPETRE